MKAEIKSKSLKSGIVLSEIDTKINKAFPMALTELTTNPLLSNTTKISYTNKQGETTYVSACYIGGKYQYSTKTVSNKTKTFNKFADLKNFIKEDYRGT